MNPRIRSRIPASIGSNQASPANKDAACAACIVVLSSPMAWSPSARQRRSWLVEQAGDYATIQFHHLRDGTAPEATGEPGKSSAGELGRLAVRAFFSVGAGLLAWSHMPVETAQ